MRNALAAGLLVIALTVPGAATFGDTDPGPTGVTGEGDVTVQVQDANLLTRILNQMPTFAVIGVDQSTYAPGDTVTVDFTEVTEQSCSDSVFVVEAYAPEPPSDRYPEIKVLDHMTRYDPVVADQLVTGTAELTIPRNAVGGEWTAIGYLFCYDTGQIDGGQSEVDSESFTVRVDSDGDGIYDSNDNCPDQPGPSRTDGCPDSDGDGVRDSDDEFPHDPDCVEDSDNDGVCDNNDAFPNNPDEQYDSDGDGIGDNADECPERAGSEQHNGCPDSDGDGVPDPDDLCPDQGDEGFGIDSTGCPIEDSDNDGVPDPDDDCQGTPEEASVDDTGCPVDSDGDGVPDYRDDCPHVGEGPAGITDAGCPVHDEDGDGVTNRNDACPKTWGRQADGCPGVVDQIINLLADIGLDLR